MQWLRGTWSSESMAMGSRKVKEKRECPQDADL